MNEELSESQRETMISTGEAFYKVREKRLFRAEYTSFEDYVKRRWNVPMELVEIAINFYLTSRN